MKPYLIAMTIACLVSFDASADQNAQQDMLPSLADHLHISPSIDPDNPCWLPDLSGLPDEDQLATLTAHVMDVIKNSHDSECNDINWFLRMMIFQHFVVYQQMANAEGVYFDDTIAHQWAHVLGMILKESNGDSTNITDMCGYTISSFKSKTDVQQWKKILGLTAQGQVELNDQTNFGLAQLSSDRLFNAFTLSNQQQSDTEFLQGEEGAATPEKEQLNTATAIRKLIWFYQTFSQGRISEQEQCLPQEDVNKPEYAARYQNALRMSLLYCGTPYMFNSEADENVGTNPSDLETAMASIAYCPLGNSKTGYGMNEFNERCFAQWVTLCPALNVDIATLTPLSYFQTRNALPICESVFKQLINQKPGSTQ